MNVMIKETEEYAPTYFWGEMKQPPEVNASEG